MSKLFQSVVVALAMTALPACAGMDVEDVEDVGTAEQEALANNALANNALANNALANNALANNALANNALANNALSSLQDPTPSGDLFRQLVKYTVGCALTTEQSFRFSWVDSDGLKHDETYLGLIGLAPTWADGPIDVTHQRMVSSCLAARTNYYGVTVQISMRSSYADLAENTTSAELAAFPNVEGAFWGNLFASTPYLNTCYNPATVTHSREAYRACAAGYVEPGTGNVLSCGMIYRAGPCSSVCSNFNAAGQAWGGCVDHPGSTDTTRTSLVITTGLK